MKDKKINEKASFSGDFCIWVILCFVSVGHLDDIRGENSHESPSEAPREAPPPKAAAPGRNSRKIGPLADAGGLVPRGALGTSAGRLVLRPVGSLFLGGYPGG